MKHESTPNRPVSKQSGLTAAERFLARVGERSFLSLWCYPNVFYEKGKEFADMLVAFKENLIIFSDKACNYPNTSSSKVNWQRWFRRAVLRSAQQIWGAERAFRRESTQLWLDPACTHPFPIDLPPRSVARIHRVVVAHAVEKACRQMHGGSGSLMLAPEVIGAAHFSPAAKEFTIGDVDPSKGFVHVFDESSLMTVMRELDTVSDFVEYLTTRETLFRTGRLGFAAGEENLLAVYLLRFFGPQNPLTDSPRTEKLLIDDGLWDEYTHGDARLTLAENLDVSYQWDRLIEAFGKRIIEGTAFVPVDRTVAQQERAMHVLASENRFQRRDLASALNGFMNRSVGKKQSTFVMIRDGDLPTYAFLLLDRRFDDDFDPDAIKGHDIRYWEHNGKPTYRSLRIWLLNSLLKVTKVKYPQCKLIVGIATEPAQSVGRSEDLDMLDATKWTEQDQADALKLENELKLIDLNRKPKMIFGDNPRRRRKRRR